MVQTNNIRIGVVGCGLAAQSVHLPYLQELSHCFEIGALCDISPGLLDPLCRKYNVRKRFVDYRELLEEDLDAVFILTRDHEEIASAAAKQGMHIFVEKPIAYNLAQADAMIHAARQHGIKLMVGYMRRYDPGFRRALEMFRKAKGDRLIRVHSSVGMPLRLIGEMFDFVSSPKRSENDIMAAKTREETALLEGIGHERRDRLTAYYLLLQVWSHNLNTLRGAFGDPMKVNYAEVRTGTTTSPSGISLQIVALLDYGPEATCIWETRGFSQNENWDEELTLFGTEQTVTVRFPFPFLKNIPSVAHKQETTDTQLVQEEIITSFDEAFKRELRHFHDCVVNDREPLTNGEDARKDLELAISMMKKAVH